jgi:hypothetical protein
LSVVVESAGDLAADLERQWKKHNCKLTVTSKVTVSLLHRVDGDQRHIVILIGALLIVEQGLQ